MEKEDTKPLATDSFSYSWLTHQTPSSSISPKLFENPNSSKHSFDFDVPKITQPSSHSHLVHADEIFSQGRIMPVYTEASTSVTAPRVSVCQNPPSAWRKASRKILRKCYGFVRPLVKRSRKTNRVGDLERKVSESNSCEVSPRLSLVSEWVYDDTSRELETKITSPSRLSNGGFDSCDAENSIHEAILYCKRSIGVLQS